MRRLLLALLLASAAPCAAEPVAGTCRVTQLAVIVRNLNFNFVVPGAVGYEFPAQVDAARGTFSLDRSGWIELDFTTVGFLGLLDMDRTIAQGTIDGGGNVSFRHFGVTWTTYICDPPCVLPNVVPLSTGPVATSLSGTLYVVRGQSLNFETGELTLAGHVSDPYTPGAASTPGVRFTCVLDPRPDAAALPAPPRLLRANGKARVDATFTDGDQGDRLTLKTRLVPGATPLTLDGSEDVFVRLAGPERDVLLLAVPAGRFTVKGKKLTARRDDTCDTKRGVCKEDAERACTTASDCAGDKSLQVVLGRKRTADAASVVGGTLVLAQGKKGTKLALALRGLDLAALTEQATLSVSVGTQAATQAVRVTGGAVRRLRPGS
jgi:hypothetical protein